MVIRRNRNSAAVIAEGANRPGFMRKGHTRRQKARQSLVVLLRVHDAKSVRRAQRPGTISPVYSMTFRRVIELAELTLFAPVRGRRRRRADAISGIQPMPEISSMGRSAKCAGHNNLSKSLQLS